MPKDSIARYEIRSELGRGGMAVVYLAYDPNFRRNVAVKLVSGNFQDNVTYRERFEREARLIAKIEHPAIVPVYDFGEQDGQLYLVMRYMPGGSLGDKIRGGALTLGYAVHILSQIAPALDAVHSQGIVHRDLKPGNILLDGFGNAAISDFGIAHFTTATSDLTGSAVIGTPSYMSPEQVRADADLDGRSDIYALGAILFEMLTGRGLFLANTPMIVALKHLTDPVPSIGSFRPDLPAEVEPILNKALAKDREQRFAKASDLASALRAIPGTARHEETHADVRLARARSEELSTEVDMSEDAIKSGLPIDSQPGISPVSPAPKDAQPKSIPPSSVQAATRNNRSRILQIAALSAIAIVLFAVCGSLGVFGTWAGLANSFSQESPTSPITDAAQIQEIILFSDDFTNPASGWPSDQNPQSEYGYRSDGYRILAIGSGSIPWVSTDRIYDDVSLSVDAAPIPGNSNGYYGLLCRIEDAQNFYYFAVSDNGYHAIGKYKNGEFQLLSPDGWRYSNAINQASQTNRIRADCTGDTLRLYANEIFLGEANDSDLRSGFSGMIAAALDTPRYEVVFDNFIITALHQ